MAVTSEHGHPLLIQIYGATSTEYSDSLDPVRELIGTQASFTGGYDFLFFLEDLVWETACFGPVHHGHAAPARDAMDCWADLWQSDEQGNTTTSVAYIGPGLYGGQAASRFALEIHDDEGTTTIETWFVENSAVPVVLDAQHADGHRTHSILIESTPGTGTFRPEKAGPDLPPLHLVPAPAWGIVDDRLNAPFPAEKAWQVALADPEFAAVVNADTDAAAAIVSYDERHGTDSDSFSWTFSIIADERLETWHVVREQRPGSDTPVPGPATSFLQSLTTSDTVTFLGEGDREGFGPLTMTYRASHLDVYHEAFQGEPVDHFSVHFQEEGEDSEKSRTSASTFSSSEEQASSPAAFAFGGASVQVVDGRVTFVSSISIAGDTVSLGAPTAAAPEAKAGGQGPFDGYAVPATFAVGTSLAVLLVLWLIRLAGVPLFTRFHGKEAMEHPTRQALLHLVEAEPGIHLRQAGRRLGASRQSIEHHVRILQQNRLLQSRRLGRYVSLFPPKAARHDISVARVNRSEGSQKILAAVQEGTWSDLQELQDRSGLSRSTVHYHVQRLAAAGALRGRKAGHRLEWAAA